MEPTQTWTIRKQSENEDLEDEDLGKRVANLLFVGDSPLSVRVVLNPGGVKCKLTDGEGNERREDVTEFNLRPKDNKSSDFVLEGADGRNVNTVFNMTGAPCAKEIAQQLRQLFDRVRKVHVGKDQYAVMLSGRQVELGKLAPSSPGFAFPYPFIP